MTTYKSQQLFDSGPHAFRVRGLSLRHELIEAPGVDGAQVVPLGRTAREIEQFGVLYADTIDDLQAILEAIESAMDGAPGELIDAHGRTWERMVLVEFNPARIRHAGVRFGVNYTARYVQTLLEAPVPLPL